MTNLIAQLTQNGNDLIKGRATRLAERIGIAQGNLMSSLRGRIAALKHDLSNLLDLGPTQTTQLSVGHESFSPGALVSKIQELKVNIKGLENQLALAQQTAAAWGASENDLSGANVLPVQG